MHRAFLFVVALLLGTASFLFGDLKIKTRTTVMGHTTESTVYIKGARQRSEMNFGGRGGMATITQCDQKRMITIVGDHCSYSVMGSGGETTCPSVPAMPSVAGIPGMAGASAPPRKGGVITITRTSTDTGERQDMFGYKAKHIRSTMMMVSSPDACHPSNMKMETDGWYADVSTAFSCGDESVRALACGGMGGRPQPQCRDRIVFKGGGGSVSGFPLKQTTTMNSEHGNYTVTTEVVELTSTALDAPLFDMPAGCQTTDIASAMGGAEAAAAPDTAATPAPAANEAANPQPTVAPPPPATVAPKTPGVVRVGVVNIKDMSGQNLPTDNLRINLMSEISARHMEAVPLEVETPLKDVEAEARAKECDYILFTVPTQVKEPGTGGLPAASLPRGTTLDPAKFQALTAITVYKVGKPLPEIKDFRIVADGEQFGVNAVMATFEKEGDKLAQQVEQDAHAHAAGKSAATKTTKPKSAAGTKPH
jgi:hypothetical protein